MATTTTIQETAHMRIVKVANLTNASGASDIIPAGVDGFTKASLLATVNVNPTGAYTLQLNAMVDLAGTARSPIDPSTAFYDAMTISTGGAISEGSLNVVPPYLEVPQSSDGTINADIYICLER